MRRDDRTYDATEGSDEIAAIESQWTRIWEAQGGPQGRADRILRRDEFRIMWPYIKALPKGSRLLDGGCGMGDWVLYFTRAGYPTVGLDVSKLTIAKLQALCPEMEFAVGDIRATRLPDSSFDAYFSWGTFEHFEEGLDPVVREAYRVLKPGGLLFVSTPFDNVRHSVVAALRGARNIAPELGRKRFYQWRLTRRELANTLARQGFAVDDVKVIHKRQGMLRWLQHSFSLNPYGRLTRGAAFGLTPFVPASVIGHMVLAIARRPAEGELPA